MVIKKNPMKTLLTGCIALLLYIQPGYLLAIKPSLKYKMSISLESKVDKGLVSLIFNDDQIGVYHHFILERSIDGKVFTEVARVDEIEGKEGARQITFRDYPFEKSSLSCVFYRIRAVDNLGWFDFTNVVSVFNKLDIARNPTTKKDLATLENQQQF